MRRRSPSYMADMVSSAILAVGDPVRLLPKIFMSVEYWHRDASGDAYKHKTREEQDRYEDYMNGNIDVVVVVSAILDRCVNQPGS
jgi:hypothetical protein